MTEMFRQQASYGRREAANIAVLDVNPQTDASAMRMLMDMQSYITPPRGFTKVQIYRSVGRSHADRFIEKVDTLVEGRYLEPIDDTGLFNMTERGWLYGNASRS